MRKNMSRNTIFIHWQSLDMKVTNKQRKCFKYKPELHRSVRSSCAVCGAVADVLHSHSQGWSPRGDSSGSSWEVGDEVMIMSPCLSVTISWPGLRTLLTGSRWSLTGTPAGCWAGWWDTLSSAPSPTTQVRWSQQLSCWCFQSFLPLSGGRYQGAVSYNQGGPRSGMI